MMLAAKLKFMEKLENWDLLNDLSKSSGFGEVSVGLFSACPSLPRHVTLPVSLDVQPHTQGSWGLLD